MELFNGGRAGQSHVNDLTELEAISKRRLLAQLDTYLFTAKFETEEAARLAANDFLESRKVVVPKLRRSEASVDRSDLPHSIRFEIPFDGTPEVFLCKPSRRPMPCPSAVLRERSFVIEVPIPPGNSAEQRIENARARATQTLDQIEELLERLRTEAVHLNTDLRAAVTERFLETLKQRQEHAALNAAADRKFRI